jgi:hypothetical protein
MSERYEWAEAERMPIEIVEPGTHIGEWNTTSHALILGDPDATAFVVEGSPQQLCEFASRIVALVRGIGRGAEGVGL